MIQKLKMLIISVISTFAFAVPIMVASTGSAVAQTCGQNGTCPEQAVCGGAQDLQLPNDAGTGTGCPSNDEGTSQFNKILKTVINVFSVVVGVVAVIMLIVGGFRYITSGGSADKVTSAKNTILYALIGLIIVALAQIIVKFVLNKATQTG